MGSRKEHDKHTTMISLKPSIIGLEGILLSTAEANIFNSSGVLLGQPDNLLFDPSTQTLYNVEYKCYDHFTKAKDQLRKSKNYLKRMFPNYEIINLYVSKDYEVRRL